jgi:membrane protein implicated in regulation of membrane protease activity
MTGSVACIYHWYTQALFFAPVLLVGVWCWRRYRSLDMDKDQNPPAPPAASSPTS